MKMLLQKQHNNYKNVFVVDYEMYIKNEAFGLPRLNKVARDIIFRYCTFSKKYRESLTLNVLFQPLIEHWKIRQNAKAHTFDLFRRSILKMTEQLPKEVEIEEEFLNK